MAISSLKTILAAATLLAAGPLLAQTAPSSTPPAAKSPETASPTPPPQGQDERRAEMRERMLASDTNKDGQWSREEWLAAGRRERGFEMMDADKNGQLTAEEMRAGMEKMRGMRGGKMGGGRRGASQ